MILAMALLTALALWVEILLWALLYRGLDLFPGLEASLYFSGITFTTVGYGDIVPTTPTAQMASVALSISGPRYLALVMGLLISRYTIQGDNQQEQNPADGE